MKYGDFAYWKPASVAECVEALADEDATILAGGQSLLPLMALRLAEPTLLVDVSGLAELGGVVTDPARHRTSIGAAVTQAQLEDRGDLATMNPLLPRILPVIGHRSVRTRGTVGGSVAHADPAAEWPALCVALNAEIELQSRAGTRSVPAREFFVGPFMTSRGDDELLTHVHLPMWGSDRVGAFREVARRHGDFALVGCVVALDAHDGDVERAAVTVFGGVGTPVRMNGLEQAIPRAREDGWSDLVRDTVAAVEFHDDIHAAASLRRHLATNLLTQTLFEAREAM